MSTQLINRNNVAAGLFLIMSIFLALFISFTLSDALDRFEKRTEYIVRFPTSVGVSGLQSGAEVTLGGLRVGRVVSLSEYAEHDPRTGAEIIRALDVVIAVDQDLVLYEDAMADLIIPILGGVSKLNIASPGSGTYDGGPDDQNALLDQGEHMRGRFSPSILTQLGFSSEEADAIRETIHRVHAISEDLGEVSASMRRMAAELEPEFGQGVEDGRTTMANIRALSERFTAEDGWSTRVDSILARSDEAAAKIGPVIDDANATVAEVRTLIDENRPRVTSIMDNVNAATERFRLDTIDKIDELLREGTLALGSYREVADNANVVILESRPKINATLESAQRIGTEGTGLIEEIRSQPWRVLQKPSESELRREPIYEAARAYADAVSDLRVASEALDAAVLRSAQSASVDSVSRIREMARVVEEAYGRYTQAERALLERLRPGGQTP